ncbi:hypothetical protein IMG5_036320 [Ichthyophthirius multifiliis]|uniref:Transmembrane protein n=1 Tax=Ichthyophthirius multifiliis TaxID=5932 RepID=G0QLT5_ICHMU|nr:hypothetical protein IMG5_036320 [Ichthyophthirius multifiliis]EGR33816.1 hypothetical protein IMG5_036320 [Ichthyophthirius multifiliis]|eukprot:XP_004039040.1 hypothetical protein IMG5_036320 [Ichthyophthirius multifiliis]
MLHEYFINTLLLQFFSHRSKELFLQNHFHHLVQLPKLFLKSFLVQKLSQVTYLISFYYFFPFFQLLGFNLIFGHLNLLLFFRFGLFGISQIHLLLLILLHKNYHQTVLIQILLNQFRKIYIAYIYNIALQRFKFQAFLNNF